MSKTTENLGLFEYEPSVDGAQTFNIQTALNDNFDKIDAESAAVRQYVDTKSGGAATEANAYTDEKVAGKEDKATYSTATMYASTWTASNTYSFTGTYPSATYNIAIEVDRSATEEQYDAFCAAKICGYVSSNIVKALGEKPTVNIPIIIKAVKK